MVSLFVFNKTTKTWIAPLPRRTRTKPRKSLNQKKATQFLEWLSKSFSAAADSNQGPKKFKPKKKTIIADSLFKKAPPPRRTRTKVRKSLNQKKATQFLEWLSKSSSAAADSNQGPKKFKPKKKTIIADSLFKKAPPLGLEPRTL